MKKQLICFMSLSFWGISSFAQNTFPTTGNVGVGTSTPDATLSILRNVVYDPFNPTTPIPSLKIQSNLGNNAILIPGNIFEVRRTYSTGFPPNTSVNQEVFSVENGGLVKIATKLRIGTAQATGSFANYALSVDGDIIAKRCVIQTSNWADFVFDPTYDLPSLGDVKTFVQINKHLPGVPDAETVSKKGIEVGEINKILLQKVEELTLYMIQLKEENDQIKAKLEKINGN